MLTLFPADCCALVVEDEPVQALGLACMLAGFGCQVIGPASRHTTPCSCWRRPPQLRPVRRPPAGHQPGAARGDPDPPRGTVRGAGDRPGQGRPRCLPVLHKAPRLAKPFNSRKLYRTASTLHQVDLRRKITATGSAARRGSGAPGPADPADRAARGRRHAHRLGQLTAARDRPRAADHAGEPHHPVPAARDLSRLGRVDVGHRSHAQRFSRLCCSGRMAWLGVI